MPRAFTKPLQEDFVSDGPKLRRFVKLFWRDKSGQPFKLYPWQEWLIDRVLERYPADWHVESLRGQLRYEQCVICMGRQNGKTILAAILSLYGLTMHVPGPTVLGLAESVQQANLVYDVARFVIDNNPELASRFVSTGTRGIRSIDGTRQYRVAPGKADALQGITISFCLYDEVHLTPPDMWAAVLYGMSAVQDGMVLGITTAGDERSVLLKSLYEQGAKAVAGAEGYERFGWFLWEAPEGAAVDDVDAIKAANPSIACGAKDVGKTLNNVRTSQEHLVRQFIHNRFVAGGEGAWLPTHEWTALPDGTMPDQSAPVMAVAVGTNWEWATITAAKRVDGQTYVELVATIEAPTLDRLVSVCQDLWARWQPTFITDGNGGGKDLALRLRELGYQAEWLYQSGLSAAAETAYAAIKRQQVTHDHAAIVTDQVGRGAVKTVGDHWRIVPVAKSQIDALMATVMAIYAAERAQEYGPMVV